MSNLSNSRLADPYILGTALVIGISCLRLHNMKRAAELEQQRPKDSETRKKLKAIDNSDALWENVLYLAWPVLALWPIYGPVFVGGEVSPTKIGIGWSAVAFSVGATLWDNETRKRIMRY